MVALVLLPGMDGTGELFAEFARALGGDVRPIVVTYPKNAPIGYKELEIFVRASLPLAEPYILLGESFSGPIAISIAASQPAGLIGLVLCCTFASNPRPMFRPLRSLIDVLPISGNLIGLIAPFLYGRFSSGKHRQDLQHALSRVSAGVLRARLRAVFDVDVSEILRKIQVPTLYLQATEDRVVLASALRHITEQAFDLQITRLQAPHFLLQVVPLEAAVIVKDFIEETTAAFNAAINKKASHPA